MKKLAYKKAEADRTFGVPSSPPVALKSAPAFCRPRTIQPGT